MIPSGLKPFIDKFLKKCREHPDCKTYGLTNWEIGGSTAMRATLGIPYDPSRDVDFFFNLDPKHASQRETVGSIIASILSQIFTLDIHQVPVGLSHGIAVNFSPHYYSIKVVKNGRELYDFNIAERPIYVNVQAGIQLETENILFDRKNPEFHQIDFEAYQKNKVLIVYEVGALQARLFKGTPFSISHLSSMIKTCSYFIENDGACFSSESARAILSLENAQNIGLVHTYLKDKQGLTDKMIKNVYEQARRSPGILRARAQTQEREFDAREKAVRGKESEVEKIVKDKTREVISKKDQQLKIQEELYGSALMEVEAEKLKSTQLREKHKDIQTELNQKFAKSEEEKESLSALMKEKEEKYKKEIEHFKKELDLIGQELKQFKGYYDDMRKPMVFVMFIESLLANAQIPTQGYALLLDQVDEQFTTTILHGGPAHAKQLARIQTAAAELTDFNEYHTYCIPLLLIFVQFLPADNSEENDYLMQLYLKLNTELERISQSELSREKITQLLSMFIDNTERLLNTELMSGIYIDHKKNFHLLKKLAEFIRSKDSDFDYQSNHFFIHYDHVKNFLLQGKAPELILDYYNSKGKRKINAQLKKVMDELYRTILDIPPAFKRCSNYALQQVALKLSIEELQFETLVKEYSAGLSNLSAQVDAVHVMLMQIKGSPTSGVDLTTATALSRHVYRYSFEALNAVGTVLKECVESNGFESVLQASTLRFIFTQGDLSSFEANFAPWDNLFNDPLFQTATNISADKLSRLISQVRNPMVVAALAALNLLHPDLCDYLNPDTESKLDLQVFLRAFRLFQVQFTGEEIKNFLHLVYGRKADDHAIREINELANILAFSLERMAKSPVPVAPKPSSPPLVAFTIAQLDIVNGIVRALEQPTIFSAIKQGINTRSLPKVLKDFFDQDVAKLSEYQDKKPNLALFAQERFYQKHPEIKREEFRGLVELYVKIQLKSVPRKIVAHHRGNTAASSSSSSTSCNHSALPRTNTVSQERPG